MLRTYCVSGAFTSDAFSSPEHSSASSPSPTLRRASRRPSRPWGPTSLRSPPLWHVPQRKPAFAYVIRPCFSRLNVSSWRVGGASLRSFLLYLPRLPRFPARGGHSDVWHGKGLSLVPVGFHCSHLTGKAGAQGAEGDHSHSSPSLPSRGAKMQVPTLYGCLPQWTP